MVYYICPVRHARTSSPVNVSGGSNRESCWQLGRAACIRWETKARKAVSCVIGTPLPPPPAGDEILSPLEHHTELF